MREDEKFVIASVARAYSSDWNPGADGLPIIAPPWALNSVLSFIEHFEDCAGLSHKMTEFSDRLKP
jgi:hypothetical protein